MVTLDRLLSEVREHAWAILPGVLEHALAVQGSSVYSVENAEALEPYFVPQEAAPTTRGLSRRDGRLAVVPVRGVITQRGPADIFEALFGGLGSTTEALSQRIRTLTDDSTVKGIVLDIDSPGGTVYGVEELADEIYAAREKKPIAAIANSMAASAAYWLGSQATEFSVTPSGDVGSIGVFAMHQDISEMAAAAGVRVTYISAGKYKVEGNPFEPLTDEAKAAIQHSVDVSYDAFVKAVARGRGVAPSVVRGGMGQGRVMTAQDARGENMVDRVESMNEMLTRLGGGDAGRRGRSVEEARARYQYAKVRSAHPAP